MAWLKVYTNLPRHPKVAQAAAYLGMGRTEVVGMLVALWLWALEYSPQGLIPGGYRELGEIIGYPTRSVRRVINAFYSAGLLDKVDSNFKIHDWMDYAGALIAGREAKKAYDRNRFLEKKKESSQVNHKSVTCDSLPREEKSREEKTRKDQTRKDQTISDAAPAATEAPAGGEAVVEEEKKDEKNFNIFWLRYPRKEGRSEALRFWQEDCAQEILAGLDAWLDSDHWRKEGGRFIPKAAKFLEDQRWRSPPTTDGITPRGLDSLERAALRRLMEED